MDIRGPQTAALDPSLSVVLTSSHLGLFAETAGVFQQV